MASSSRQYQLVLLGATGYTGKLVAEWISKKFPEDLQWAIAGRNAKKLENVVAELQKIDPNRKRPNVEVVELERNQLDHLAKRTRLLMTTVGPFMHYGEPVLAACASNGTHYIDATGETPWYYNMVAKYHELAKENGAIVIPQCGLDSVPADITSFVLVDYIRQKLHAPTESVTLTLYDLKVGFSGGSLLTILDLFNSFSIKHLAKSFKPYSLSPVRPTNPAPPLKSNLFYRLLGLSYVSELGGAQTIGLMASCDTCMTHRSWGLYELSAHNSNRPDLSYGSRFRFVEYMRAKSLIFGVLFKVLLGLGAVILSIPVTRWILLPLAKRLVVSPGEGPSPEEMKTHFMHYRGLAIADTDKKQKVVGDFSFAYGGYEVTGLTMAAAADVILSDDLASTEAGKLGGGILTPATLGQHYVDKLKEYGVKLEIKTLE